MNQDKSVHRAPILELFRFISFRDKVLLTIAFAFAATSGACLPLLIKAYSDNYESIADTRDNSASDAWIRNRIARGYSKSEVLEQAQERANSDKTFYWNVVETSQEMLIYGAITFLTSWVGLILFTRVGVSQAHAYRRAYLEALLKKPINYYETHNPGSISCSLDIECSRIEVATGEKMFILIFFTSFLIFGIAICLQASCQLTLMLFVQIPITGFGAFVYVKTSGKIAALRSELLGKSGGFAEECLIELPSIQAMNSEGAMQDKFQGILEAPGKEMKITGFLLGIGWGCIAGASYVNSALIYLVGSRLLDGNVENWLNHEEIRVNDIVVISGTIINVCACISHLGICILAVIEGRVSAWLILQEIQGDQEPQEGENPQLIGALTLKDVDFCYPKKQNCKVLAGVSLSISPGQTVAFVGESGSGKSTLMALLLRYFEPSGGSISFDGISSSKICPAALRRQMSLVSQEPLLFNLSIKENIRLGDILASDQAIIDAAADAGVLEYSDKLQDGLNTKVGTKGGFLSGGQKQRIAIARALLKNPKYMLMDEATSSLDNKTEAMLSETLKKAGEGRTTLMIAQRLNTIKHADRIYVLEKGKLIEEGSHDELIEAKGVYFGLYTKQNPVLSELSSDNLTSFEDLAKTPFSEQRQTEKDLGKRQMARLISDFMKENWVLLLAGCIASMAVGFLYPAFGYLIGEVIYYVAYEDGDDMVNDVYEVAMYKVYLAILAIVLLSLMSGLMYQLSYLFSVKVKVKAFGSMLHFDQSYMVKKSDRAYELACLLTTEAEKLYSVGGPALGAIILLTTSITAGLCIGFYYDWHLTVVQGTTIPLLCLGISKSIAARKRLTDTNLQSSQALSSDIILNVKQVYAYNLQSYFLNLYMQNSSAIAALARGESYEVCMLYALQCIAIYYPYILGLWYGSWLIKEGDLSYENMMIIVYTLFFSSFGYLLASTLAPDTREGYNAALKLSKKIERTPVIDSYGEDSRQFDFKGKLEFCSVDFKYPTREAEVLKGISFTLQPGQSLGVCGSTGSGKSTIALLILRMYDPQRGEVLADGANINTLNVTSLRSQISWVPQEPVLFEGDLRFNMKLTKPDATDEEIKIALEAAHAWSFVEDKGGLTGDVNYRSQNFSGGQKQRLALARGFLRKPRLMILDEGTSALDTETESKVLENIRQLQCTVVSIAHRLTTIEHCDKIIVIELGRIIEEGTHESLIQLSQHYARLSMRV